MFKRVHRMNNLKMPFIFYWSSQCLVYQFKVSMDPIYHSVILSSVFIFLGNASSPPTWQNGAHSATMTWNFLFCAASLRKASTVREKPMVMITSFEWMCSRAWAAMFSVVPSAKTASFTRKIWNCHDMTEHQRGHVPITQTARLADVGNTGFTNLTWNVTFS